jgi:hypothetical protein
MDALFDQVKPLFNDYKTTPYVEFEFRLGKKNGTMFDTNVGEPLFNKILEALEKFPDWESVTKSNTTAYYLDEKRMEMNDDDEEDVNTFKKKKIKKFDYILPKQPLDIRFCVSQEFPTDPIEDEVVEFMRCKQRISFVRKNLSIDMTIVTGQQDDLDDETEHTYEIELEILDPSKVNDDSTLFNLIYKIECLTKLF